MRANKSKLRAILFSVLSESKCFSQVPFIEDTALGVACTFDMLDSDYNDKYLEICKYVAEGWEALDSSDYYSSDLRMRNSGFCKANYELDINLQCCKGRYELNIMLHEN